MKITYPHFGNLSLAMKSLFTDLGLDVVPPPPITKRTINLGIRHSPEFACYPLKVNMGNFIEALEAGADTIVMAGGTGPCRFGYYAEVQREILHDLGYDFKMVVIEPPQGQIYQLFDNLGLLRGSLSWHDVVRVLILTWHRIKAMDTLHARVLKVRARELEKGSATRAYEEGLLLLEKAPTLRELNNALKRSLDILSAVPCDHNRSPLRIGLVGEIYMLLEPYANLHIEKTLGEMGVEIERSIYISEWIKEHLILSSFYIKGGKNVKKAASPYLNHFVGGHGWESVGETAIYAKHGFDGVIHIMPFTCTPEIVAQSILPSVSRDCGLPVISFSLDEQSGDAGFITRIEAFLDLIAQRKESRQRAMI